MQTSGRWIEIPDPNSPMLRMKTAPRRLRREIQGKNFRPIYGFRGGDNSDWKDVIAALKAMR